MPSISPYSQPSYDPLDPVSPHINESPSGSAPSFSPYAAIAGNAPGSMAYQEDIMQDFGNYLSAHPDGGTVEDFTKQEQAVGVDAQALANFATDLVGNDGKHIAADQTVKGSDIDAQASDGMLAHDVLTGKLTAPGSLSTPVDVMNYIRDDFQGFQKSHPGTTWDDFANYAREQGISDSTLSVFSEWGKSTPSGPDPL